MYTPSTLVPLSKISAQTSFERSAAAKRHGRVSFDEAIQRYLKVMDAAARALCRDQRLPVNVFSIFRAGALGRVVAGEDEGTLVHV